MTAKRFVTCTVSLAVAFSLGFLACWMLQHASRTGLRLQEDITIHDGENPIATVTKGTLLLRNKYTRQCQMSFYLDKAQAIVVEAQDTYYSDTPSHPTTLR